MRSFNHFIPNIALILFAHVNPREGELRGLRWIRILNSEINRIFGDFALRLGWRFPREVSAVVGLCDLDAAGRAREAWKAGLEGCDLGMKI